MRVLRSQSTHTCRIVALMPVITTATAMATADPRTSSQRIAFGQRNPREGDAGTITEKRPDRRIQCVTTTLHERDECREVWANQAAVIDLQR